MQIISPPTRPWTQLSTWTDKWRRRAFQHSCTAKSRYTTTCYTACYIYNYRPGFRTFKVYTHSHTNCLTHLKTLFSISGCAPIISIQMEPHLLILFFLSLSLCPCVAPVSVNNFRPQRGIKLHASLKLPEISLCFISQSVGITGSKP